MSDLISRQAAIDAICEHGMDLERRGITVLSVANHKQVMVDLLENLPSAQPTQSKALPTVDVPDRKVGKWIEEVGMLMCSECGDAWGTEQFDEVTSFNFCPNCGAKMEEVE